MTMILFTEQLVLAYQRQIKELKKKDCVNHTSNSGACLLPRFISKRNILVTYHCVAGHHRLGSLNQRTPVIWWIPWFGTWAHLRSFVSGYVMRVQSRHWPGLGSCLMACLGKDPLPGSCDCWRNFSSLRVEGLSSWLAVGQRTKPQVLASKPTWYGNVLQQNRWGKESASKIEVTVLCTLMMQVTSHCLLLIVSRSLASSHSRGEIIQSINSMRQGSLGPAWSQPFTKTAPPPWEKSFKSWAFLIYSKVSLFVRNKKWQWNAVWGPKWTSWWYLIGSLL